MAGKRCDINSGFLDLKLREECCQRVRRISVLAANCGGDSLSDRGFRGRHIENLAVYVAMSIDETRGYYLAGRIDDTLSRHGPQPGDLDDAISLYANVSKSCRRSGSVDHQAALDEQGAIAASSWGTKRDWMDAC
jgi:hypothetical protein